MSLLTASRGAMQSLRYAPRDTPALASLQFRLLSSNAEPNPTGAGGWPCRHVRVLTWSAVLTGSPWPLHTSPGHPTPQASRSKAATSHHPTLLACSPRPVPWASGVSAPRHRPPPPRGRRLRGGEPPAAAADFARCALPACSPGRRLHCGSRSLCCIQNGLLGGLIHRQDHTRHRSLRAGRSSRTSGVGGGRAGRSGKRAGAAALAPRLAAGRRRPELQMMQPAGAARHAAVTTSTPRSALLAWRRLEHTAAPAAVRCCLSWAALSQP
jgi:hypothetical protein